MVPKNLSFSVPDAGGAPARAAAGHGLPGPPARHLVAERPGQRRRTPLRRRAEGRGGERLHPRRGRRHRRAVDAARACCPTAPAPCRTPSSSPRPRSATSRSGSTSSSASRRGDPGRRPARRPRGRVLPLPRAGRRRRPVGYVHLKDVLDLVDGPASRLPIPRSRSATSAPTTRTATSRTRSPACGATACTWSLGRRGRRHDRRALPRGRDRGPRRRGRGRDLAPRRGRATRVDVPLSSCGCAGPRDDVQPAARSAGRPGRPARGWRAATVPRGRQLLAAGGEPDDRPASVGRVPRALGGAVPLEAVDERGRGAAGEAQVAGELGLAAVPWTAR